MRSTATSPYKDRAPKQQIPRWWLLLINTLRRITVLFTIIFYWHIKWSIYYWIIYYKNSYCQNSIT